MFFIPQKKRIDESMNQYIKSLWLTETVRLIEKDAGRFNDDDANRQAGAIDGLLADRIIKRAQIISQQNGLENAQKDWLSSTRLSIIILGFISIFVGAGLAFSALAQNPVNLYWALLSLLGLHLITLVLWVISCVFMPNEDSGFFIQIWIWLTKKLLRKQTISQLLPAFITLFGKQIRWFIGIVIHLLWSIILLSALVVLIALLSTKHYSFVWQTTLFSADTVIAITHFLGKIPLIFGFAIPDVDIIRSSEHAISRSDVRSAWAIWLLGIFIVYGVFVRIILMIFCGLKWAIVCQQITLNTQYPEYQFIAQILVPVSTKSVIDKESDTHFYHNVNIQHQSNHSGTKNLLVAIDIEENWLPPNDVEFLGFLNNSQQRRTILDFLQRNPTQKLLIAIDTNRVPDRGIINLVLLLKSKSIQCKLWFIQSGRQLDNWQESLASINIEQTTPAWLLDR